MAERIVSPAVFTQENDLSYLPKGIGEIGAAIIGPTTKGQAFVPTQVTSYQEFEQLFGPDIGESYVPQTMRNYIQNAGIATIIRILGLDGYTHNNVGTIVLSGSLGTKVVGVFHHSNATQGENGDFVASKINDVTTFTAVSGSLSSFNLMLSGSGIAAANYSSSINPDDGNYLGKSFSRSPKTSAPGYLYSLFDSYIQSQVDAGGNWFLKVQNDNILFTDTEYAPGETPWVTSQLVGGTAINLFKFKTLSHGEYSNEEIKIGIIDVRKSSEVAGSDYGTFSVVIRKAGDKDKSPEVLETYNAVTLDPTQPNYIGRVIGDKYPTYNASGKILYEGDNVNKSKYIAVEVTDDVANGAISKELIPWGFAAVKQPIVVANFTFPTASMVHTQEYNGDYNSKIYYGFDYSFSTNDNEEYLRPLPTNAVAGANTNFNLDNEVVHPSASGYAGNSFATDATPLSARRFVVPFQGGFSGLDPATPKSMGKNITNINTSGYDCSSGVSVGTQAYERAFLLLSNQDEYDINLLLTPGIIKEWHSSVVVKGIDMCESRGDCFYIFDPTDIETLTLASVTDTVSAFDTNYAAAYFPWIKVFDPDRNINLWVPPSVVVAGAYSFNDRVGFEWYAPAGLNRGALGQAVDVYFPTKTSERDVLYEGRINPIAKFPGEGVVVWGQKTLQVKPSALDRINVRRLLIALKKFVASTSRYLVFEQNVVATRNRFLNIVNPYLETVQQRAGLYAYKVVMDESNNTSDVIDRNILKGEIYIQPAKTAEFIIIDFNIMPTGATFENL